MLSAAHSAWLPAAARRVAAGHLCFADECGGEGGYSVAALGAALVDAPIWTFWWD